jgi:hypothetical protein
VLSCAKEHRPLPKQGFTCCLAMDGVKVLASGFDMDEKVSIVLIDGDYTRIIANFFFLFNGYRQYLYTFSNGCGHEHAFFFSFLFVQGLMAHSSLSLF